MPNPGKGGRGSRFSFLMRIDAIGTPAKMHSHYHTTGRARSKRYRMSKRRILYIEDHEDTRDLVTFVLREREYEVTEAQSIEAAFRLAQEGKYHLYLLDSWLPDGSGIDFCKKIREVDLDTPIIFYSAAAYEDDKTLAFTAGAQGYLTKPASVKELCDMISNLIDGAETSSRAENDGDHNLGISD